MIIHLTVKDNDFGNIIGLYFKKFYSRLLYEGYAEGVDVYEKAIEINKIMNPNSDIKLSEEHKHIIINRVVETFNSFVDNNVKESAKYLKESLEVSILESIADKWENGEAWYWFQHSNTVINQ